MVCSCTSEWGLVVPVDEGNEKLLFLAFCSMRGLLATSSTTISSLSSILPHPVSWKTIGICYRLPDKPPPENKRTRKRFISSRSLVLLPDLGLFRNLTSSSLAPLI